MRLVIQRIMFLYLSHFFTNQEVNTLFSDNTQKIGLNTLLSDPMQVPVANNVTGTKVNSLR